MSGDQQTPMKVFYSYAHEDESLRDELAKQLAILKRHGLISSWHDRDITAGQEWKDQINDNLNAAQIILLLVSPDFLSSDYCYDIEMERAMELHQEGAACVIPVILRPCLWSMTSFGKLQALPTGAQPITSAPNRDDSFFNVALGIKTAIENFRPKKPSAPPTGSVGVGEPLRKELSLSTIWNVPYHRNRNFTGRDELLVELRTAMTSGKPGATIQAICGLGGVGKTQVATEYAYRHAADYTLVWWIRGDNDATGASDYAALAKPLHLQPPEGKDSDQGRAVEAVKRWLGENTGWLLIFDNLPAAEAVKPYLPQTSGGHVILTSRNPKAKGLATPLPLQVLPAKQSVQFLVARTGQEDSEAAQTLAEELGGLPLALEQAGAYMESTGCTIRDYLEILASHPAAVFAEESPVDYNETVANTWSMAIANVRNDSPGGEDLLNLCAFLGPDAIPHSLFKSDGQNVPESLSGVLKDLFTLNKALGALKCYSLIEVTNRSHTGLPMTESAISVHKLVQTVVRENLEEKAKKQWAETALQLVATAFPFDENDPKTWPDSERLLPHVLAVSGHAVNLQVAQENVGALLTKAALYLRRRAQFHEAKKALERALRIEEACWGSNHPNVAKVFVSLGRVTRDQGHFPDARTYLERALAMFEASEGIDPLDIAYVLDNLGGLLTELNDLERAKSHLERAQTIYETTLGPHHLSRASPMIKLGRLFGKLKQVEQARARFLGALLAVEKAYGQDSIQVAVCLNSLGGILHDLEQLNEAQRYYQRALSIREASLGADHPNVASTLNNLGLVLRDLDQLPEAQKHLERALTINEKTFGPHNPEVGKNVNNLGRVLEKLGDFDGAQNCYARALEIFRNYYGGDHPHTMKVAGYLKSLTKGKASV